MLNFNGIYECALHPRDLEESPDRLALASALRLELENVVWPSACPWIGTDSWLLRFIDRAEDSLKEPIDQDADGKPKPKLSAKERVLATLKWREENGVNTILETKEPAVLQIFANWPFDVHGATTKGDIPIVIERVALVHPRPFLERFTLEESTRAAIYVREWLLRELYERTEGKLSKYVFICSAAGLGFRHGHHPLFTLLDRVFMMDEAHYPNSVCSYFVIQTPWLFSLLKTLLSPFVDSEPLQKIKTYSSHFHEDMLKLIGNNNEIPLELSGSCSDHTKLCLKDFSESNLLKKQDEGNTNN